MKFLKIKKLIKKIIKNEDTSETYKDLKKDIDKYMKLSNVVKESRCNKNLTQEDLSRISKIPLSIIIAIENNQKDLIPEYPFIRSILLKLEQCLSLRKFKLINLVKEDKKFSNEKIKIRYFTNKLDLINSWQGNVIYIFILLLSLLILNSYFMNTRNIEFKCNVRRCNYIIKQFFVCSNSAILFKWSFCKKCVCIGAFKNIRIKK